MLEKAFKAGTGVHRRGNLDVRLLSLLLRIHGKGSGEILNGVDVLLDQYSAWFWLTYNLVKRLFHSQDTSFEAVNGACAIASLLDLQIIQALLREDVGVSLSIISNRAVNVFWACLLRMVSWACWRFGDH